VMAPMKKLSLSIVATSPQSLIGARVAACAAGAIAARAIATVLDERGGALPEVPTVSESGYPQISVRAWAGLFGPARMPRDVTQRLSRELTAVLQLPAVQEQLALQGFMGQGSTPEELADITREQLQLWGRAVREAGIKPE